MKVTSPFYDAEGNHFEYDLQGGDEGWLVVVAGRLDAAQRFDNVETAIESIMRHTARLAGEVVGEHCINIAEKFVSQGLMDKAVPEQLGEALGLEN